MERSILLNKKDKGIQQDGLLCGYVLMSPYPGLTASLFPSFYLSIHQLCLTHPLPFLGNILQVDPRGFLKFCKVVSWGRGKGREGLAPLAHAYNPSYSGGRDQEDRSSKLVWANSS
jgi:hypothetical protein